MSEEINELEQTMARSAKTVGESIKAGAVSPKEAVALTLQLDTNAALFFQTKQLTRIADALEKIADPLMILNKDGSIYKPPELSREEMEELTEKMSRLIPDELKTEGKYFLSSVMKKFNIKAPTQPSDKGE